MRTWKIGQIGQTEIRFYPAMLLYVLYAVLTGHLRFMLLAVISILMHEGAHAGIAWAFGQPPNQIELSPLGAVMRLEDDNALSFWKRIVMLLAGPAMTFGLCWVSLHLARARMISPEWAAMLFMTNVSILLLNLLPVLPLDGGRVLSLLLECFIKPHIVSRIMFILGTSLGLGLIVLNIWSSYKLGAWNLSLAFIGCCMMYCAAAATTTRAMAELRYLMDRRISLERRGLRKADTIMILHTQKLYQLVKSLPPHRLIQYIIIEVGSMKTLGVLTEYDVITAYLQHPNATCGQLCAGIYKN